MIIGIKTAYVQLCVFVWENSVCLCLRKTYTDGVSWCTWRQLAVGRMLIPMALLYSLAPYTCHWEVTGQTVPHGFCEVMVIFFMFHLGNHLKLPAQRYPRRTLIARDMSWFLNLFSKRWREDRWVHTISAINYCHNESKHQIFPSSLGKWWMNICFCFVSNLVCKKITLYAMGLRGRLRELAVRTVTTVCCFMEETNYSRSKCLKMAFSFFMYDGLNKVNPCWKFSPSFWFVFVKMSWGNSGVE